MVNLYYFEVIIFDLEGKKIMPIIIKEINSLEHYISESVKDINRDQYLNFQNDFVYRGLSSSNYLLETSLKRNCKKNMNFEKSLLRNFTKHMPNEYRIMTNSIWDVMVLGQHHGLPTRLLDWSHSPLIALHFATVENMEQDSVIWKVSIMDANKSLPNSLTDTLILESKHIFTLEDLKNYTKRNDNELMFFDNNIENGVLFFAPPNIDDRIAFQRSIFSITKLDICIEDIFENSSITAYKYIIPYKLKWYFRDFLDHSNISERILFPGLDGLCKWLARCYYTERK